MGLPVYDTAARVLHLVVDDYELLGAPIPARQYVADGASAWDCEQVSVWVERVYFGDVAAEQLAPIDCLGMRSVELMVEIVRCSPTLTDSGDPPPAAAIDESAQVLLEDPVRVIDALAEAHREGWLGPNKVAFGSWEVFGPQGGFVAGRQSVHVGLYGLLPDLGS